MADVVVNITDLTRPITKAGFGLALILGVTATIIGTKDEYNEYTSLTEVATDFASTTDEYKAAAALFAQSPRPEKVAIYNVTRASTPAPADLTDALDDMANAGKNNWYWIVTTSKVAADIAAISDWVDANNKLFGVGFNDADVANIVAIATANPTDRLFVFAHKTTAQFPEAALIGRLSPLTVGSWTAKFKNLNGITDPSYTTTELSTLDTGKVITYKSKSGILQTTEGKVTSGSYIDMTISKDWLAVNIQAEVMSVLINSPKVPYTDSGIIQIVDAIKKILRTAVTNGILESFTITAPKKANISNVDISNRLLPDINFTGTIQGAVHKVTIDGVVKI